MRIEEFVAASWSGEGRPPHERSWLANAFVAKAVLGLGTTSSTIERLTIDRALRRICGFPSCKKLPSESTFSCAFDEFSEWQLAEHVHEALIKVHLGETLIGHISRDGTAVEARKRPARSAQNGNVAQDEEPATAGDEVTPEVTVPQRKRGRPRRGKTKTPAKASPLARQRQ